MSIENMHYNFKRKLNKVDSQENRNLLIPEIDTYLNEALEIFVKMVAFPSLKEVYKVYYKGFENGQRTIDDIRPLIKTELINVNNGVMPLPDDYWYRIRMTGNISKGECNKSKVRLNINKHNENFENNPLFNSSFEWGYVNGLFINNGVEFYTNGFTIDSVKFSYIKKPLYMNFSQGFGANGYDLPNGTTLTVNQDCELEETAHNEIVDIAVLIATGELQIPDYNLKFNKTKLT